jgi:hypothetical protein
MLRSRHSRLCSKLRRLAQNTQVVAIASDVHRLGLMQMLFLGQVVEAIGSRGPIWALHWRVSFDRMSYNV